VSLIQEVSAEDLARLFHHYHDVLTHEENSYGESTNHVGWDETPANERQAMITAARLALMELATTSAENRANRKYFAKPGEADWGC